MGYYGSPSGNHPNCAIETLYLPPRPLTTTPFPPISTTSTPSSRSRSICLSAPRPLSPRGEMYPLDAITLCRTSRRNIDAALDFERHSKEDAYLPWNGTVRWKRLHCVSYMSCMPWITSEFCDVAVLES